LVDSGSHHFTGSQLINGDLTITGSVSVSGSVIQNKNTVNGQYMGVAWGGNVGVYDVSNLTEIGLALDGEEWTTNWSNGPLLYVNNTPEDTYEGVFGFQNKTNYTDGRITLLKNTDISGSLNVTNSESFNIAYFQGNNEYYGQVNIKNTNSGSNSSTDLVLTANNGTETNHYVDLGINSSTYGGGLVGGENDAYLLNVGKDLYIGTIGGSEHPAKLFLFAENNWENPQVTVHTGSQITFNTPSFTEGYMYEFSGSIKSQDDLSIDGSLNIGSVNEKIVLEVSGGTSTYEFNYSSGSVFYVSSSLGNNVYNVSNVPTEDLNAVSLTFIIKQESTPYIASSYKLNNENVSVSWANNEAPIGNSNKTDVIGLTALRVGSSWNVLGTFTTFG
jgi:hypothetical protein